MDLSEEVEKLQGFCVCRLGTALEGMGEYMFSFVTVFLFSDIFLFQLLLLAVNFLTCYNRLRTWAGIFTF